MRQRIGKTPGKLLVRLLKKDEKRAEEMAILSYVSCCAEAVSATLPLPDFSSTLEDFYLPLRDGRSWMTAEP